MNGEFLNVAFKAARRGDMWFSRRLAPIRGLYNENDDYAVTTFFFPAQQSRLTKISAIFLNLKMWCDISEFHDLALDSYLVP